MEIAKRYDQKSVQSLTMNTGSADSTKHSKTCKIYIMNKAKRF